MKPNSLFYPYIEALDGPYSGQHWPLRTESNILGRDPECEVCLQERPISRHHARLFMVNGIYYIQDLESQNGTWLNSQRIHEPCILKSNDVINLAQAFSFKFIDTNPQIIPQFDRLRLIKIYLAAPGDITNERVIVNKVVDYLAHNPLFRNKIHIVLSTWEKTDDEFPLVESMLSEDTEKLGIIRPSECEIVILILWSQLGKPIIRKQDGYLSLVEWTFREAYDSFEEKRTTNLLVYRRMEEPVIGLMDPNYKEKIKQFEFVEKFFLEISDPRGSARQGYHPYFDLEQFREKLENHIKNLLQKTLETDSGREIKHIEPAEANKWISSPFPGLRAYMPSDNPIFFGRDRETNELIKLVGKSRFISVVGASGSGKSSLVGAGVIPDLLMGALEGSRDWLWLRFTPGGMKGEPYVALAEAIADLFPQKGWSIDELSQKLSADPNGMSEVVELVLADRPRSAELLIFIDQFEELFTIVGDKQRDAFIKLLAIKNKRIRIIVTLRSDFFYKCIELPELTTLFREATFPLSVPTPFMLLEMIKKPAERADLQFEDGLPEKIVDETEAEPGALALMAYLLDELYRRCQNAGKIGLDDYLALGGVRGAIGQRAEEVYLQLDENVKSLLPFVFRELVEVDLRGTATRHRSPRANISSDALPLVEAFINARLLTSNVVENMPIVEVSHEAIFENWERLRLWILKSQEDLILHRQLKDATLEWELKNRPDYLLWPAERLQTVYEMQRRLGIELDQYILEFIKPESERLLPHINHSETDHQVRSQIGERLSIIGDPRPGVGLRDEGVPDIVWCEVPSGQVEITIKSDRFDLHNEKDKDIFIITPSMFYIAKFPITFLQYQAYLKSPSGINNNTWWTGMQDIDSLQRIKDQFSKLNSYPRENVNWYQAIAFSRWLDSMFEFLNLKPNPTMQIRLPFEWEWQLAATGGIATNYPWGEWNSTKANTSESGLSRTTAVGMYPGGAALCGALDMSGNVWEWCINNYDDFRLVNMSSIQHKSIRGGSFDDNKLYASVSHRDSYNPAGAGYFYGFRLVCAPKLSEYASDNIINLIS